MLNWPPLQTFCQHMKTIHYMLNLHPKWNYSNIFGVTLSHRYRVDLLVGHTRIVWSVSNRKLSHFSRFKFTNKALRINKLLVYLYDERRSVEFTKKRMTLLASDKPSEESRPVSTQMIRGCPLITWASNSRKNNTRYDGPNRTVMAKIGYFEISRVFILRWTRHYLIKKITNCIMQPWC